jgi:hypothetical protein
MKGLRDRVVLILVTIVFILTGCVEVKILDDNKSNAKIGSITDEVQNNAPAYGAYTEDIDKLLAVAPIGSKVTLDETEDGDIHLKIEKVFTARKSQDEVLREDIVLEEEPYQEEIDSSLYGDTITI